MATFYDYENRTAFDPHTQQGAPNATGSVYAKTDTTFSTPLTVVMMSSGLQAIELTSDQYSQLPGFQVEDHLQVVFKSGDFTKVLNTTTPLVGPAGPAVAEAVDNGDNTVTFLLEDGSPAATVTLPASEVPGPPGSEGPRGLPGPNAVPADEAVGTYATTPGTATHTALTATTANMVRPPLLGKFRASMAGRNTRPVVMVAAGDSITAGFNAVGADNRWVNLLAAAVHAAYPLKSGLAHPAVRSLAEAVASPPAENGVHVINAGVGGTTAANYLTATTGPQVAALNPDVIIHSIGTNDRNAGGTISDYIANLTARLNQLDADIAGPVLHVLVHQQRRRTYVGLADWQAWGDALKALAESRGNALYVDLAPHFEAANVPGTDPYGLIDTDEVHPTSEGHEMIKELLREQLHIPVAGPYVAPVPPPEPEPEPVETATIFTSDSFNRADTAINALGVTDGGLGGTSGYAWSASSDVKIISNQVGATSLSTTRSVVLDSAAADHEAKIKYIAEDCGVVVRGQASGTNPDSYRLRYSKTAGQLVLLKVAGGASTTLATFNTAMASGDTFALRAVGSTLRGYHNGVEIITHTDTSFPAGSWIGFHSSFNNPAFRLDDFVGSKITFELAA